MSTNNTFQNEAAAASLAAILARHGDRQDALLPLLHDIQDAFAHIPPEAVPLLASKLNLSRAEVHGVITYYHHFRQTPPGRHVLRVCRAEACQAVGGESLAAHAEARLKGGDLTLEAVYCLGLCAIGPALQVDEMTLHGHMTPDKFDALATLLEAQP